MISAERIRQLQTDFTRQGGVQPTSAQLQALIQEAVDDELLYREARQLRLDFQDRSIRTRLVQKMRAVSADPSQDEEALYRSNSRLSQNARKMVVGAQEFLRFGRLGACVL